MAASRPADAPDGAAIAEAIEGKGGPSAVARAMLDAHRGLGEAGVSGRVTPDHRVLDRRSG